MLIRKKLKQYGYLGYMYSAKRTLETKVGASIRSVFSTLSNIYDRAFSENA